MKRQNTTVVGQNSSGHTYKPAVAVPMNQQAKVNGVAAPERRQGKGNAEGFTMVNYFNLI
jgi:hypothetical protein